MRSKRTGRMLAVGLTLGMTMALGLATGGAAAPTAGGITANSFNRNFTTMAKLKPIVKAGHGKIAVILPDTVTSARYTEFDAPFLKTAFTKAGMPRSEFIIQNAQGSDSTQLTDAQADIARGATVIAVDPLDSGVGAQIEKYAKSHGAKVIDYDRLTLGGTRDYYVSFDNVRVGKVMGQGLVSCVKAWHVSNPNVIFMRGAPTDNNATLFFDGSNSVLKPLFTSGKWKEVATPAGTWTPTVAATEFQQALTAHPSANAALVPNDENAGPIIQFLQTQKVPAKTFPITGQDATLVGLQNIISGYQCGTVYKPIYLEAQATAALAIYLRANMKPPAALVNGKTEDTTSKVSVKSVLLTPKWVTPATVQNTVIKDRFVKAKQLCTKRFATDCKRLHIH